MTPWFQGEEFSRQYVSTIGVDFEIKQVTMNGKKVHLQIVSSSGGDVVRLRAVCAVFGDADFQQQWDTAGQERFRTVTTSYYRSSDAILVCFDVTDDASFTHIPGRCPLHLLIAGCAVALTDMRAEQSGSTMFDSTLGKMWTSC